MKSISSLGLFLLPFLFSTTSCLSAQKATNADIRNKIQSYLAKAETEGFSGAVLVAYQGQKILSKGIGYSDKAQKIENGPLTVFDIGSITKQFTAAAILKLEMQKKLSVNDKLIQYFPNLPNDKKDISIHHLLTHSAGLVEAIGDDYEAITTEAFLQKVFATPLISPVGRSYHYSNIGYSLLAILIEKVTHHTYEHYLRDQLFLPADMQQTGYVLPTWAPEKIAVGYHRNKAWRKPNQQKWANDGPYLHLKGNGGILSTTEDMYRWHLALLGEDILDQAAKEKYYTPHISEGEGMSSFYGYGWAIFPTPRKTHLITHNGGNGIFFADFWRYLEEDLTILFMTNKANRKHETLAVKIAKIVLNKGAKTDIDADQETIHKTDLNQFFQKIYTNIQIGKETDWEKLITENATTSFKQIAPMETHFSFFKKFKQRLKGGTIQSIEFEDGELIGQIKTPFEVVEMIVGVEINSTNQFLLSGLILN